MSVAQVSAARSSSFPKSVCTTKPLDVDSTITGKKCKSCKSCPQNWIGTEQILVLKSKYTNPHMQKKTRNSLDFEIGQ